MSNLYRICSRNAVHCHAVKAGLIIIIIIIFITIVIIAVIIITMFMIKITFRHLQQ